MKYTALIPFVFFLVAVVACSGDKEARMGEPHAIKERTTPSTTADRIPFIYSSEVLTSPDLCAGRLGLSLRFGYDSNLNQVVDLQESRGHERICDGENGHKAIVQSTPIAAGTSCSLGGMSLDWGIDENKDHQLSDQEVINNARFCHLKRAQLAIIFPRPDSDIDADSQVFMLYVDARPGLETLSITLNEQDVKHLFARSLDTSEFFASISSLRPFFIENASNTFEVSFSGEHVQVDFDT